MVHMLIIVDIHMYMLIIGMKISGKFFSEVHSSFSDFLDNKTPNKDFSIYCFRI